MRSGLPADLGWTGRCVGFALRAYPAALRREHGSDLLTAFLDQRDAALAAADTPLRRAGALILITGSASWHVIRAGFAERLAQLGRPIPPVATKDTIMTTVVHDVRRIVRGLLTQPGFVLIAAFTLAMGIGANTAVFTVVNNVLLSPLPYDEPEQLVRLYQAYEHEPEGRSYLTGPDVVELDDAVSSFADLGVMYTYREVGRDLIGADGLPRRVRALQVNSDYFRAYRATPLVGRSFTDEEERGQRLAILSHRLWRDHSESDPDVVGRSIALDGVPYTVLGVMRPTFLDLVGGEVDVWIPLDLSDENSYNSIGNHYLTAVARLGPGVSVSRAQSEVTTVFARMMETRPNDSYRRARIRLVPLFDDVVGSTGTTLYVLLGAAGLVLLIACVNVANLFLTRGVARSKEMAIRIAIGSSRRRLFGYLIGESLFVSFVGGAAGLVLSYWGVNLLLALSPESLPRAEEIGFDVRLLAFAAAATVVTGVVFGAAPAFRATRIDPNEALRDGTRGSTGGRRGRQVRSVLVGSQMALALVLLVGAGLLSRSFVRLQQIELGIDERQIMTFEVHLPPSRYADATSRVTFHRDLHDELARLPGVERVGATSKLPAAGRYHHWGIRYVTADGTIDWTGAQIRVVEGDYFSVFDIPVLRGRRLEPTDVAGAPLAAVINRTAAETAFADRDAVGETVSIGGSEWTVVGVVDDVAHDHMGSIGAKAYLPHAQFGDDRNWALTHVVRTSLSPAGLTEQIRAVIRNHDRELVLYRPATMEAVVARQAAHRKFSLVLMAVFAGVALSLAAVGIYGVLSHSVQQRTHEIGIRMALGAAGSAVRRLVLRQVAVVAGIGLAVGLAGALGAGRLLQSLLYETKATDPLVYGSVALVLTAVAAAAAWLPTLRATKVSPMNSLRKE